MAIAVGFESPLICVSTKPGGSVAAPADVNALRQKSSVHKWSTNRRAPLLCIIKLFPKVRSLIRTCIPDAHADYSGRTAASLTKGKREVDLETTSGDELG